MAYFIAISDKQLGICLRMLFAEGIQSNVKTIINGKGKIEFHIEIAAEKKTFAALDARYKIMIA